MKTRILNSVLVSAVLIASGCDSSPLAPDASDLGAQAKPADVGRRPVLFWQTLVLTDAPAPEVVDGVLQVRGFVFEGAASGDLVGQAETLTNADINLTTGVGPAWGTWSITTADGGWEGSFEGLLTPTGSPGSSFFDGTYVIKGTGANRGRIIRGSFTDSCDDGCMSGAPDDGDGEELYKAEGVMVGRPGGSE